MKRKQINSQIEDEKQLYLHQKNQDYQGRIEKIKRDEFMMNQINRTKMARKDKGSELI